MSKSLGNLVFVSDLVDRSEAAAVRLALLGQHYRHDWEWHDGLLDQAVARLATWRSAGSCGTGDQLLDDVRAALDDDLDTPRAVALIDDAAQAGYSVTSAAALLGVTL